MVATSKPCHNPNVSIANCFKNASVIHLKTLKCKLDICDMKLILAYRPSYIDCFLWYHIMLLWCRASTERELRDHVQCHINVHSNRINWHATINLSESLTQIRVNFDNTSSSVHFASSKLQIQSPMEFRGITGVIKIVKLKVGRNSTEFYATHSVPISMAQALPWPVWPPDICYSFVGTENYIQNYFW